MKVKNLKRYIALFVVVLSLMANSLIVFAENYAQATQPTSSGKLNTDMFVEDGTLASKNPYMIQVATHNLYESGMNAYDLYYTIYSATEIVIYEENERYYVLSLSNISGKQKELFWFNFEEVSSDNYLQISILDRSYSAKNGMSVSYGSTSYASTLMYNSNYVFDGYESAMSYLETGSMDGLLKEPSKEYDSENICLNNFRMDVYDSNVLEEFYIDFYYEPSQALLDDIDNAFIEISYSYDIDYDVLSGALEGEPISVDDGSFMISLAEYPNSFRWYVSDYFVIRDGFGDIADGNYSKDFCEGMILGDEVFFDSNGFSFGNIGGNSLTEITKSEAYVSLVPYVYDVLGMSYGGTVDFLNPSSSYSNSYSPDSEGNYTSNNDYVTNDGYYYTEVSKDNHGNNVYNYYYITDNSKTEINQGDSGAGGGGSGGDITQNNEVNVPSHIDVTIKDSSDDDITIEDDDYTADALHSLVDSGFGFFDDLDTEQNDDGFMSYLTAFFMSINPDLAGALGFGMGATIMISVIRSIFKR